MTRLIVRRRTFEATTYPKGSAERDVLNLSALTSEYMTSYKYVLCDDTGKATPYTFRTRSEAEAKASAQ